VSTVLASLLGGFLIVQPATLQVSQPASCQPVIEAFSAKWRDAGFPAPSKPSAAQVYGAHGLVRSGPEVTLITRNLQRASIECERGHDQAAINLIMAADHVLDPDARFE